jgi:NADH-quinone oxidoreductase subunit I
MKKVTQRYPEVLPDLPPRSKGSFGFDSDICISCGLCADACPNGVIKVDYYLGEKNKRQLELYSMNLGYCLFCGLCVEACPTDAIFFKTDFELACFRKDDTMFTWRGNGYRPPQTATAPTATPTAAGQAAKVAPAAPPGPAPAAKPATPAAPMAPKPAAGEGV